jgi:hypothetical protein
MKTNLSPSLSSNGEDDDSCMSLSESSPGRRRRRHWIPCESKKRSAVGSCINSVSGRQSKKQAPTVERPAPGSVVVGKDGEAVATSGTGATTTAR